MVRQKTDLRIHEEISVLQKKLSETDIQLTEEKKVELYLYMSITITHDSLTLNLSLSFLISYFTYILHRTTMSTFMIHLDTSAFDQ